MTRFFASGVDVVAGQLILRKDEFFASPAQAVAVADRYPQNVFAEHTHEFCELVLVWRGNGLHLIARILDGLNDPLVGFVIDQRYIDEGKTLPWVMGGFPSGYEPKAAAYTSPIVAAPF